MNLTPLLPSAEDYLRRAQRAKAELARHIVGQQAWSETMDQIARLEDRAVAVRRMEARLRAAGDRRRL
jgi:hypothetical protein